MHRLQVWGSIWLVKHVKISRWGNDLSLQIASCMLQLCETGPCFMEVVDGTPFVRYNEFFQELSRVSGVALFFFRMLRDRFYFFFFKSVLIQNWCAHMYVEISLGHCKTSSPYWPWTYYSLFSTTSPLCVSLECNYSPNCSREIHFGSCS